MRPTRGVLVVGVALALAGVLAGAVLVKQQAARRDAQRARAAQWEADRTADPAVVTPPPSTPPSLAPPAPTAVPPPTPVASAPPPAPAARPAPARPAAAVPSPAPVPAEALADVPLPRLALSCVGFDPLAEQVWTQAINDPSVSAHDRQDLIEDLNEEGFPDPRNLTLDDLPLIQARIAVIEQHAPEAMDEVNAAAFQEAYKDLLQMQARLTQR